MQMESKRFDELRLQGRAMICPICGREFPLTIEDTTGGGYGAVGIKCPNHKCGATFAIDAGSEKK